MPVDRELAFECVKKHDEKLYFMHKKMKEIANFISSFLE
jgi:hypothetical protein